MTANFFKEKYLLLKAKNKDAESYSQVYDLFAERIYRFIFFKVSREEDAQDLTSEVFLKVWQHIVDGQEIKNLNAFFYKVARNLVIDHYRKASQRDIGLEQVDEMKLQNEMNDLIKEVENKIQVAKIEDKLAELKDEYREIIVLRYIEGLSINEISEITEKKKGAVRVILYRALNTLKELMEEKK